ELGLKLGLSVVEVGRKLVLSVVEVGRQVLLRVVEVGRTVLVRVVELELGVTSLEGTDGWSPAGAEELCAAVTAVALTRVVVSTAIDETETTRVVSVAGSVHADRG